MSAVSRVNEIYAKAHTYKHVLFTNICISGPNSVTNILITRRGGVLKIESTTNVQENKKMTATTMITHIPIKEGFVFERISPFFHDLPMPLVLCKYWTA